MRATYVPDPASTVRVERLVLSAPVGLMGDGELTLYLPGRRRLRGIVPARQRRDLMRRWAAAAHAGKGVLLISE